MSTDYLDKIYVRIPVMITCGLSIVGSLLIIFSFILFKDLRSRGRQLLLNLSLMDFGVAAFNLLGASVYFDPYYHPMSIENCTTIHESVINTNTPTHEAMMCPKSLTIHIVCITQAVLSMYFTHSSILWTNSLSFYLYFRIVHNGTNLAKNCLRFSYFLCYALPVGLTMWLLFTGRVGFSPYESTGWCSIILKDPVDQHKDVFATVFGYNLWIGLSFVLIPLLSLATHCYVRQEMRSSMLCRNSERLKLALFQVDYKFVSIPVAFVILRLWSFLEDVLPQVFLHKLPKGLRITLKILAGIGDSGQGITNAIMFVFLTKEVRKHFLSACKCFQQQKQQQRSPGNIQRDNVNGENRKLLEESTHSSYSDHSSRNISCSLENTPPPLRSL